MKVVQKLLCMKSMFQVVSNMSYSYCFVFTICSRKSGYN